MTGVLYNPLVAAVGVLLAGELVGAAQMLGSRRAGSTDSATTVGLIPARS
jgi:hypothetical protein